MPNLDDAFKIALKQSEERRLGRPQVTFRDLRIRLKEPNEKGEIIVPLSVNTVQEEYCDLLDPEWRERGYPLLQGVRDIVLKSRQLGFTTLLQAAAFCHMCNFDHWRGLTIAHDLSTAREIFQMQETFLEHLPPGKKPIVVEDNNRRIRFSNGSRMYIGSAENKDFGAGGTNSFIDFSEAGRYQGDVANLMASAADTVPAKGSIILESTARGMGNYFHSEWERSQDGGSVFRGVFIPWYKHEDYRMDPDDEDWKRKFPGDWQATPDELRAAKANNLDRHQLAWRRWKQAEQPEMFKQNYPETPDEAFLSTGAPYFPIELLRDYREEAKKQEYGYFDYTRQAA
jgi:hypothetical protein